MSKETYQFLKRKFFSEDYYAFLFKNCSAACLRR